MTTKKYIYISVYFLSPLSTIFQLTFFNIENDFTFLRQVKVACRVEIWRKKNVFKIMKSLVTVLLKMTLIIWIYHILMTTDNCYAKTDQVYVSNFNILFKTVGHWKTDFLQLRIFSISFSLNIFVAIKEQPSEMFYEKSCF